MRENRFWLSIRQRGWAATLRLAVTRLAGRKARAIAVHPFDTLHAVETSGLIEGRRLVTGHPHDAFSTAYFAVAPSRFAAAIRLWQTAPETGSIDRYTFIDVGCGKGRALLLASAMGFRDVIGVELHPELARVAQQNIKAWQAVQPERSPARVLCADASAVKDMLAGPVLLYLYNPFHAPVLRSFLAALLSQPRTAGAPLDLLYLYPEHAAVFAEFPQFELLWNQLIPLAPDEAADGISAPEDPCSLYRLSPRA